MKRELHVRFCEGLGVQLPWATHLWTFNIGKADIGGEALTNSPPSCSAVSGGELLPLRSVRGLP
jgi:hypothetical protein